MGRCALAVYAALMGLAVAGCMKTTRVEDGVTTQGLVTAKKAVALMRLGSASPNCLHTRILLGTRVGEGYRRAQVVVVANLKSLAESQVAEVELDPGEYHIIGYACVAEQGQTIVTDKSSGELFRTSYAHFTLAPGEIVNVGYFHFGASKNGRSLFDRAVRTDVEVSEWPLAEIERFRKLRPAVFAQMTTRLMIAGVAPSASEQVQQCESWRKLKADGKAQDVPVECGGTAKPAKVTTHGP